MLCVSILIIAGGVFHPVIAWCDAGDASPPLSPPGQPLPLPEAPSPPGPEPRPVVIPRLPRPLLSDEARGNILFERYLFFNPERSLDLGRMVSTIDAQIIVERSVEAALVHDGLHPDFIIHRYPEIRDVLHSPRGRLFGVRTYESYVTQIMRQGTRESVPYRRVLSAIRRLAILLVRHHD
jgi:photosystem II P680 reaction center D1 protein